MNTNHWNKNTELRTNRK